MPAKGQCRPYMERLWSFVDRRGVDECWNWTGTKVRGGYGEISLGPLYGYRRSVSHRAVYEALVGPIPDGMELDHLCRNPSCVNPRHLEAVTHRENLRRSKNVVGMNIGKTHCKHGHEFTPENTYIRPDNGTRRCKACMALADRRYREKQWKEVGYS